MSTDRFQDHHQVSTGAQVSSATVSKAVEMLPREWANSWTHAFGLILSLCGLPLIVTFAALHGDAWHVVSCSIFASSMVGMFLASTFYHSERCPVRKHRLRILDHISIFVLIAGSYSPFCLVSLRDTSGWALFGVVWGIAVLGIVFKLFFVDRFTFLSTLAYLAMGWVAVPFAGPMLDRLEAGCLSLLLAAGVVFSVGTIFYLLDRIRGFHAVWHIFVLGGCACLYGAVFGYVIPHTA